MCRPNVILFNSEHSECRLKQILLFSPRDLDYFYTMKRRVDLEMLKIKKNPLAPSAAVENGEDDDDNGVVDDNGSDRDRHDDGDKDTKMMVFW